MQTQERSIIEKKPQTEKRYYTPEEYQALEEAAIAPLTRKILNCLFTTTLNIASQHRINRSFVLCTLLSKPCYHLSI